MQTDTRCSSTGCRDTFSLDTLQAIHDGYLANRPVSTGLDAARPVAWRLTDGERPIDPPQPQQPPLTPPQPGERPPSPPPHKAPPEQPAPAPPPATPEKPEPSEPLPSDGKWAAS
jgi:hypothetical protein